MTTLSPTPAARAAGSTARPMAHVGATARPRSATVSSPSRATRMLATTAIALGATSLTALVVALSVVAV